MTPAVPQALELGKYSLFCCRNPKCRHAGPRAPRACSPEAPAPPQPGLRPACQRPRGQPTPAPCSPPHSGLFLLLRGWVTKGPVLGPPTTEHLFLTRGQIPFAPTGRFKALPGLAELQDRSNAPTPRPSCSSVHTPRAQPELAGKPSCPWDGQPPPSTWPWPWLGPVSPEIWLLPVDFAVLFASPLWALFFCLYKEAVTQFIPVAPSHLPRVQGQSRWLPNIPTGRRVMRELPPKGTLVTPFFQTGN